MAVLPVIVAAVTAVVVAGSSVHAAPPRDGANHRLGDDSFVARFGRLPDAGDPEPLRMRVHLDYVRARLGDAPATRPELAARRAELLGYLDDYIAKGTTPINTTQPRRSPVFIDETGAICAVGYLIERSVGRPVAERIAASHRFDYLEDIAAALPEARAWIAGSGFTLDELASIQPAYSEPRAKEWHTWDLVAFPQPDGPHDKFGTGTMRRQRMEGPWQVKAEDGSVLGRGELVRGAGAWTSFYDDDKRRAEGRYVANRAHGRWTLYHPSGNVAAEGAFVRGDRDGKWTFYHDTPDRTPIAIGRFAGGGHVSGTWRHFDAAGKLIATTSTATPDGMWVDDGWMTDGGEGHLLDLAATPDGIKHRIHQGLVGREPQRLESLARNGELIYIHRAAEHDEVIYDRDGNRLARTDDGWTSSRCGWSALALRVADAGDLAFLHGLLYKQAKRHGLVQPSFLDGPYRESEPPVRPIVCRPERVVSAARGARLDELIAARTRDRAATPAFVRAAMLGDDFDTRHPADDTSDDWARERRHAAGDLTRVLAAHMIEWQEWPHIDNQFAELFDTMPGRFRKGWVDGDPQRPDEE